MQIDGHIYVLLKNGNILDLYRSAVAGTVTPAVTPAITGAISLSEQPDRPYFYIADDQGRILRETRHKASWSSNSSPKDGEASMNGIKDLAVDDGTSTAYILTDKAFSRSACQVHQVRQTSPDAQRPVHPSTGRSVCLRPSGINSSLRFDHLELVFRHGNIFT